MISIRRNVFETNSSSTHSLTMCSESEYNRWQKGELLYHRWNGEFKTKEQIINDAKLEKEKILKKQENGEKIYSWEEDYLKAETDEDFSKIVFGEESEEEYDDDSDWYTFDRFWDSIDQETFTSTYTTEKGETIVAFGYYGYDG